MRRQREGLLHDVFELLTWWNGRDLVTWAWHCRGCGRGGVADSETDAILEVPGHRYHRP